jgi:hypothetical protein
MDIINSHEAAILKEKIEAVLTDLEAVVQEAIDTGGRVRISLYDPDEDSSRAWIVMGRDFGKLSLDVNIEWRYEC